MRKRKVVAVKTSPQGIDWPNSVVRPSSETDPIVSLFNAVSIISLMMLVSREFRYRQ